MIDFVDMGIGDTRFFTFNVADSAISTALFLLIVIALFGERLTRADASQEASADGRARLGGSPADGPARDARIESWPMPSACRAATCSD